MSAAAKRYLTKEVAEIQVYGRIGVLIANLKNISHTGAFFIVRHGNYIPKKGDLINMTVKLDAVKRSHSMAAEVIWSRGMRVGICFVSRDAVLEKVVAKGTTSV